MDSRHHTHRLRHLFHKLRTDPEGNDGGDHARRGTGSPPEMPPEMVETPTEPEPSEETMPEVELSTQPVDVLIYTNRSFWITLEDAAMAAETTKSHLDSARIQAEITKDDAYVREWMLHATGDGNANVIVL